MGLKIPERGENPNGFHRRYEVSKVDGSPTDEKAEYMVLRLDWNGKDKKHIKACRIAALAYAAAIEEHLPQVAEDIRKRYSRIPVNPSEDEKD